MSEPSLIEILKELETFYGGVDSTCEELGISRSTWSRWINGIVEPNNSTIKWIKYLYYARGI